MNRQVIYIRGSACPYDEAKIRIEIKQREKHILALRKAGYDVVEVGNPRDGFLMKDVKAAFRKTEEPRLVIVHAHGNIDKEKHFLRRAHLKNRSKGDIWAADFYKFIAGLSQKPINLFLFSCGSGNGCVDAVKSLPPGSTLVNMTEENKLESYTPNLSVLDVTASENPAENLFLSLLCKSKSPILSTPQISISTADGNESDIWSLWDVARLECLETPDSGPQLQKEIMPVLQPYIEPERLDTAIETLSLFATVMSLSSSNPTSKRTPVMIRTTINHEDFYRNVIRHGLLGPMCAVGYATARRQIGAFQTVTPA